MSLLSVNGLQIRYPGESGPVVDDVSFSMQNGEAVGLVGGSGSGKTQTALAIMGLLPSNAEISGSVQVSGQEIVGAGEHELSRIRARKVAMVFQDPGLTLNPYVRIGRQIKRIVIEHGIATGKAADAQALQMLQTVGLPDAERQFRSYPHQLSGGMRQRVMIASALIGEPDLLIADEPTTALDVTVQAQILFLLQELRHKMNTAMLLITHDLGVIAGNSDRMLVMDRGRLIEGASTEAVFAAPKQPATQEMIRAATREITGPAASGSEPLLQADDIAVSFPLRRAGPRRKLNAVLPASLTLARGESVAIVGESGSGKTSLVRAILGLLPADAGTVSFLGKKLEKTLHKRSKSTLRQLQMVFQDPLASLNPAMRVETLVAEPLQVHEPRSSADDRRKAMIAMLENVGLSSSLMTRFPHELSGGQAQRVAIARALIVKPSVLVCDEALAALDSAVKHDVLSLLRKQQEKTALSLIFISHDLGVVREISHRVLVMYMGRLVETAPTDAMFARPQHPYTRALIDAVPVADPSVAVRSPTISGEVASLLDPPAGCVFHPRCVYAIDACSLQAPALSGTAPATVACHRAAELDLS